MVSTEPLIKLSPISHLLIFSLCICLQDSRSHSQPEESAPSPSLDDCLKLLKGERDEQRLAGLLVVTKFCKGDDAVSLRKIYDAVGPRFLDRLLRTGNLLSYYYSLSVLTESFVNLHFKVQYGNFYFRIGERNQ